MDTTKQRLMLYGSRIGISVSESEKHDSPGFSRSRQVDITSELAKYLVVNGAHVVYGGNLRKSGYTFTFSGLASENNPLPDHSCFTNFLAWPYHLQLQHDYVFSKETNLVKVRAHSSIPLRERKRIATHETASSKNAVALSLSAMRRKMIKDCNARIVIGGSVTGYKGFYPGIIEEAYYALKSKQPVFVSGVLEGASAFIIRALRGEDEHTLAAELLALHPEAQVRYLHNKAATRTVALHEMLGAFKKLGINGLSQLNKLSEKENEVLFSSTYFHEILYHSLIGLKRAI